MREMEEPNSILTKEVLSQPYKQFAKQIDKIQQLAFPSTTGSKVSSDAFGESEEENDKVKGGNQARRSFYRKKGLGSAPVIRECARCKVRETPMWRSGPQGKGTLCNACGVKWSLAKHRKPPTREYRKRGSASETDQVTEPRRSRRRSSRVTVQDDDSEAEEKDEAEKDSEDSNENNVKQEASEDIGDKENMFDNEDFFKEGKYYCRYCEKTWPLDSFKNGQQFGAHCSNCSRRKRKQPGPSSVSSRRKDKKFIQRRTMERQAERERRMNGLKNGTTPSVAEGEEQPDSLKRKKESDAKDASKRIKLEEGNVQNEDSKPDEANDTEAVTEGANENGVKMEREMGDLTCTESIEEEAKENEEMEEPTGNGDENSVHTGNSVNGEQRKLRRRKGVNTVENMNKGKEKVRGEYGAEGSSRSEEEELVPYEGNEHEEEEEEEEEEYDDEGHDLRFFERIGDPIRGLLTGVAEERISRKEEKKINLLQSGLIVLRNDVNIHEESKKKERKALKKMVSTELHKIRNEFEYSLEVIKARFGYQLKSSDEEERNSLETFAKQIEQMVETLQGERDQISTLATSQRSQNQLMSQLEQVTRLFSHGCEASLDAIRREGGETGRDCLAEIDRVDKEYHANFLATQEECEQLFATAKASFLETAAAFRRRTQDMEAEIKDLVAL